MAEKRTTEVVHVEKKPFGYPFVLALAAVSGPDPHIIFRITKAETKLGRDDVCDIVLNDKLVSSEHFVIRINGTLYSLVDLGSTNGTSLNDRPVAKGTPARLKNLDEIKVGSTRFLFIASHFQPDQP